MANLNIANDSHKEYLSNKLKNQNCFAGSNNARNDVNQQNQDSKKTTQDIYKSYLDAQVYSMLFILNLIRLRKRIFKRARIMLLPALIKGIIIVLTEQRS
jgi:hypothetical protein